VKVIHYGTNTNRYLTHDCSTFFSRTHRLFTIHSLRHGQTTDSINATIVRSAKNCRLVQKAI